MQPSFSVSTADTARRAQARAARAYAAWRGQPSWAKRLAGGAALLVAIGLAGVLLIAGLVVGVIVAAVGLVALSAARLARVFTGPRGPRGVARRAPLDDGRRNVRVVVRHPPHG